MARALLWQACMVNPFWLFWLNMLLWPQVGLVMPQPGLVADDLRGVLLELFSPPAVYGILPAGGEGDGLFVVGTRGGLAAVERVLSRPPCCSPAGDVPPLHVTYLEHADAVALARILNRALPVLAGLGPVRIHPDAATNSLIVEAAAVDFTRLGPLVRTLDRSFGRPRQVSIPAVVVEAVYGAWGVEAGALALYCHVVEGTRCFRVPLERIEDYDGRYDPDLEAGGLPAELARLLVLIIDPRSIEHARGNGVKLRCRRAGVDSPVGCVLDWGWGKGWERVVVPAGR